jgi:hypothetical protein
MKVNLSQLLFTALTLLIFTQICAAAEMPAVTNDYYIQQEKLPVPEWLRCPLMYCRDGVLGKKHGWCTKLVEQVAENNGNLLRASVMWGGRAHYQSKVAPHTPGLKDVDNLKEAVETGDRLGVKILTYINPNCFFKDHPLFETCALHKSDGSIVKNGGYGKKDAVYVCPNNPAYRKFYKDVLTEIFTNYGAAGLYVDGLTPHVCFCEHCQAKYREMFGEDIPKKFEKLSQFCVLWEMSNEPKLVGDPADPDSKKYTAFLYKSLCEITELFTNTVKKANPEAVVVYHSWPKPDIIDLYSGTLSEIYIRKPWIHTLWKDGELASYASVFGMPIFQNVYLQHKTDAEARHKMYDALANGVFPDCWSWRGMKTVFGFIKDNAQYYDYATTEPVASIALVRGIHNDSAQKKIDLKTGFSLKKGHKNFLRIQERDPHGKIDLFCFRRDAKMPQDSEFKDINSGSSDNIIFVAAEDFVDNLSRVKIRDTKWIRKEEKDTLTGKCVYSTGHANAINKPISKLVYRLPRIKDSSDGWSLWVRVLMPNSGSDSFFWSLSTDAGRNWIPDKATQDSAVGWKINPKWMWLKATSLSAASPKRPRFLAPYAGMYSAILRSGLPVVTLHKGDFHKRLSNVNVLCLANEAWMNDEQIDAVRKFVAAGGGLIATHETSLYDSEANRRSDFGLADVFGVKLERMTDWANREIHITKKCNVTNGFNDSTKIPYDESSLIVKPTSAKVAANLYGKGFDEKGIPAIVTHTFGKGRVVYMPVRLDSIQCEKLNPQVEQLFANAVEWVSAGKIAARVKASAPVAISVSQQPGRRIIHLVNHNAPTIESYDKIEDIENVKVQTLLPAGQKPVSIKRLKDKSKINYTVDGDHIAIDVGKIGEYEAIAIELAPK